MQTPVLALLDVWRAAERKLDELAPDDPERPAVAARVEAARVAYTAAFHTVAAEQLVEWESQPDILG